MYANIETPQTARDDIARGIMRAIMTELGEAIESTLGDKTPLSRVSALLENVGGDKGLSSMLKDCCQTLDKALILFIDEIDALIGDTLVSVLRQL